jgi:hypothetical protein
VPTKKGATNEESADIELRNKTLRDVDGVEKPVIIPLLPTLSVWAAL